MKRDPGFSTNFAAAAGTDLMWFVVVALIIAIVLPALGIVS